MLEEVGQEVGAQRHEDAHGIGAAVSEVREVLGERAPPDRVLTLREELLHLVDDQHEPGAVRQLLENDHHLGEQDGRVLGARVDERRRHDRLCRRRRPDADEQRPEGSWLGVTTTERQERTSSSVVVTSRGNTPALTIDDLPSPLGPTTATSPGERHRASTASMSPSRPKKRSASSCANERSPGYGVRLGAASGSSLPLASSPVRHRRGDR